MNSSEEQIIDSMPFMAEGSLELEDAQYHNKILPMKIFDYLDVRNKHSGLERVQSLTDCIQICQMSSDFLERNPIGAKAICKIFGEISERCARECQTFPSESMRLCAEQCLRCAKSFQEMGQDFL